MNATFPSSDERRYTIEAVTTDGETITTDEPVRLGNVFEWINMEEGELRGYDPEDERAPIKTYTVTREDI